MQYSIFNNRHNNKYDICLKAVLNEDDSYIMRVEESWQSRNLVWLYLRVFPIQSCILLK